MRKALFGLGGTLMLSYGALLVLAAGCQDAMIYFPSRQSEAAALRRAERDGLEPWRDGQGRIVGWRRPSPAASDRLLVFHGNAGSALDREPYATSFGSHGWEVMIFEYPGYGPRAGRPGSGAFIAAARVAIAELASADPRPLYLLGESIGTGVACTMLEEAGSSVSGALLVVPFARLTEVARKHYWFIPTFLLRDRFDNVTALRSCRVPVAFVVAGADEVVGADQGRKLHAAYPGPKLLVELPGASHNGFALGPEVEWVRAVQQFLRARARAS